ncbi:response regulator [Chitinophaga pinensis]|uniref:Response regulator transcription factor n=1 Tax=Chitinophaga pinensis TaxID=79329 RepID=A0A5C6LVC8_9BACT|nr:response regulator transcription factor [Chitinophaga pinensis]TWW01173.1 response regulator transcription factor [Chitinophaga pinensis]
MPIKLAIADDHPIVANGICSILRDAAHVEVTDIYTNGNTLLKGIRERQPDVLLLDMHLPDMSGPELAASILKNYPQVRILVLSSSDVLFLVKKMLKLGCMGYLLKESDDVTILQAIETVQKGGQFLSPALNQQLIEDMFRNKKSEKKNTTLTRREKEVLQLIIDEHTNQEIADKLFLSLHTVENHRISLLHKLEVKNTAGLVKVALQTGLV